MSALQDYQLSAQRLEEQRAALRKRMVHAARITNPQRRQELLAKLHGEFVKIGAVKA